MVTTRLVEDEVVSKTADGSGADADELAKAAQGTEVRIVRDEGEGFFRRLEQSIRCVRIVAGDVPPVLLQIEADARLDEVVHHAPILPVCSW